MILFMMVECWGGVIKITDKGKQLEMYSYCSTDFSSTCVNTIDLDSVVSFLDWNFLFECGLRVICSYFC